MDVSRCREIVRSHLPRLMNFLCIGHWSITPVFERLDGTFAGQCWPDPDYCTAKIIFDAEKCEGDELQLLALIVHELTHVVFSPFTLYQRAVLEAFKEFNQPAAWNMLSVVATHAEEQAAINLERIWGKHLFELYLESITRPD